MKVYYDDEVDALYLKLGDETPEGVIEISDLINLDTTSDERIVGIEILNASKKIDLRTILSYTLEFEKELITRKNCLTNHSSGRCLNAAAEPQRSTVKRSCRRGKAHTGGEPQNSRSTAGSTAA